MLEIILSFLITWTIGLLPPVIIRYLIIRKPMNKKNAIITAVIFGFANLIIFIALGSTSTNPMPKFLIGYVSYLILQSKGSKTFENTTKPTKTKNLSSKKKWALIIGILLIVFSVFLLWPTEDSTLITEPTDKSPEHSQVEGNMYRNTKYGFRVKFPEDWEIKSGDGPNIVQKATSGDKSISILVRRIGNEYEEYNIKDILTLDEQKNTVYESLQKGSVDSEILDFGETKIDNKPAYWIKYYTPYTAVDVTVEAIGLQYQILHKGNLYSITASTTGDEFSSVEGEFKKSIATFVFENYD